MKKVTSDGEEHYTGIKRPVQQKDAAIVSVCRPNSEDAVIVSVSRPSNKDAAIISVSRSNSEDAAIMSVSGPNSEDAASVCGSSNKPTRFQAMGSSTERDCRSMATVDYEYICQCFI